MQYLCNICANLMRVILTLPLPVWWRLQLQWTPPPCTICVRFVQHMCRYSSNVRILNKGENIWKKYTWKYLCYTCANICARKMMARVAVRPLPVQIRRESSYLPHTDPQCPLHAGCGGVTCATLSHVISPGGKGNHILVQSFFETFYVT